MTQVATMSERYNERNPIDDRIAELIGWTLRNDREIRYYDPVRGAYTPYYTQQTELGVTWSPTRDLLQAMEAAALITDRRRYPFRLERTTQGYWRAVFVAQDEVCGVDVDPLRALTEALLKVARLPDLTRLFGRPGA